MLHVYIDGDANGVLDDIRLLYSIDVKNVFMFFIKVKNMLLMFFMFMFFVLFNVMFLLL